MNLSIRTKDYYEGIVDAIYRAVSGPILHLGMFEGDEPREVAAKRTKEYLTSKIGLLRTTSVVVDLGSGYGDTARFLADKTGCRVLGVNLIHSQNVHALSLKGETASDSTVWIIEGNFSHVPLSDGCADIVWSQEAFLHARDRKSVLQECMRLLASNGRLIFTDILQTAPLEVEEARRIYERVHIESLESLESYQQLIQAVGLQIEEIADLSRYAVPSYQDLVDGLKCQRPLLVETVGAEFVDYTIKAMGRWVRAAEEGSWAGVCSLPRSSWTQLVALITSLAFSDLDVSQFPLVKISLKEL